MEEKIHLKPQLHFFELKKKNLKILNEWSSLTKISSHYKYSLIEENHVIKNGMKLKKYVCMMLCAALGWAVAISMLEVARIHSDKD